MQCGRKSVSKTRRMSSQSKGPWDHLAPFPHSIAEEGAVIGNHHFLVLPRCGSLASPNDQTWPGYRIYDAMEDKWSGIHSFSERIDQPNKIAYCIDSSILYLDTANGWSTMNIRNKMIDSYPGQPPCGPYGSCPGIVVANKVVHVVGGTGNSQHFVWSEGIGAFAKMHDIGKGRKVPDPTLIHIPSKKSILMIGGSLGSSGRGWGGEIWKYDLDSRRWSEIKRIKLRISGCFALLTADEQYVVIGGGYTESFTALNSIHILDIRDDANYKLKMSRIQCPWRGDMIMMKTGGALKNGILVIGWIRKLFADEDFKELQLPPIHVMLLVTKWHTTEYIHCIRTGFTRLGESEHLGISLDCILANVH